MHTKNWTHVSQLHTFLYMKSIFACAYTYPFACIHCKCIAFTSPLCKKIHVHVQPMHTITYVMIPTHFKSPCVCPYRHTYSHKHTHQHMHAWVRPASVRTPLRYTDMHIFVNTHPHTTPHACMRGMHSCSTASTHGAAATPL